LTRRRFLGYDEGKQTLGLYDTSASEPAWLLSLAELPLARDLQKLDSDKVLVGFDHGYFEIEVESGTILALQNRWNQVSSVRRVGERTLLTGIGLEGRLGVTVATLTATAGLEKIARRAGDYVRMMRPTPSGSYLLCSDDHILETTPNLVELRKLSAPGFRHAWMAQRLEDASTLVSAGYGAFMARFDAEGRLCQRFGGQDAVPSEVCPFFYAAFQVMADGHILVANWQGHGPANGHKGRQLVEFDAEGTYIDSWSNAASISSLQGLLVL